MSFALGGLAPGSTFAGRYRIERCIRAGGMGAVYEVVHLETRRRRALKVMLPNLVHDEEMRRRFRAEATVASEVYSDHIVETFDAGVDPETGAPFLVMELLQGEELADVLTARSRLSPGEVVGFLRQVAAALDKTHAKGIVHRDLKPENLFLTAADDGSPRIKVLDFGIAKVIQSSTQTGGNPATRAIGTPLYMAPEQIEGRGLVPATDLYALTQIAYTLLVGEPYFAPDERASGNLYAVLMTIAKGPTDPASVRARSRGVELPAAFDAWFARGTAHAPGARFASAGELVAALGSALAVSGPAMSPPVAFAPVVSAPAVSAHAASLSGSTNVPVSATARSATRPRPRWLVPAVASAVAVIGIAVTLAWAMSGPKKRTSREDDEPSRAGGERRNPVSDYMLKSKTAEAKNTLGAIRRAAQNAYEREVMTEDAAGAPVIARQLCGSAIAVPAKVPQATKYMPSNAEGQDFVSGDAKQGWKCLRFSVDQPIYYQYEYRVGQNYKGPLRKGPDPGPNGFEVSAEGDLDGDGKTSLFTVTGSIDPKTKEIVVAPGMFVDDELE